MNIEIVKELSYTDFVWELNQWNSLPGWYTTLNKWINFWNIDKNSYYLDVACTTWLKSRTISELTGCRSVGIDVSEKSINAANFNLNNYSDLKNVEYFCTDWTEFHTKERFTHISFWASLRFFQSPEKMISNSVNNLLQDWWYILASEFFVSNKLPKDLCDHFYSIFDIYPTNVWYKEVMNYYKWFEIMYEDINEIIKETEEELSHYCHSTVMRYFKEKNIPYSEELYDCIYKRLYNIKNMSNELRSFQKYNVLVLRYRKKVYPNRYIELF